MKSLPLLLLIGFISTACNVEDLQEVAQEQVQVVDEAGEPVVDENGQPVLEANNTTTMDTILEVVNNFFNNPNNQLLQIELYNQFNAFDDRVDEVEDNLEDINETIANMNTQIGQITGEQIANFQTEVDASLGVINGKLSANETAISTLNTQMSQIQTDLATFQESVDNQISNQNTMVANSINNAIADLNETNAAAALALNNEVDQKLVANANAMNTLSDAVDAQIQVSSEAVGTLSQKVDAMKILRNYSQEFDRLSSCGTIQGKQFFLSTKGKMTKLRVNLNELATTSSFNLPGGTHENTSDQQPWIVQVMVYKGNLRIAQKDIFFRDIPTVGSVINFDHELFSEVNPGEVITVTAQLDIGSITPHDFANDGVEIYHAGMDHSSIPEKWEHCISRTDNYMAFGHYTNKKLVFSFDVASSQIDEQVQVVAPEVFEEAPAEEVAEEEAVEVGAFAQE